jgi:hypothetical protein
VAIKGKGKTRSRPPARAPRRAPVEVPTPFGQRRWVQIVAALLIGAGIVWFLIWLTNGIRQGNADDREAAAAVERRRAVQGWKELVETEMPKVGALGSAGTPPTVAAELTPTIESLEQGDGDAAAIEGLDERLVAGATTLEDYDLAGAIRNKGFDVGEASALLDSQAGMTSALRSYAVAARLTVAAAGLPERDRSVILDEARAVSENASATLQAGWNDYLLGLGAAGLTLADGGAGLGGGIDPGSIPAGG